MKLIKHHYGCDLQQPIAISHHCVLFVEKIEIWKLQCRFNDTATNPKNRPLKTVLKHTWRILLPLSAVLLVAAIIFDFYGAYTGKFYILDFENYILPILALINFAYIYGVWFKLVEDEFPDPLLRNLEYTMYIIVFFYCYKIHENIDIVAGYNAIKDTLIPENFLVLGITAVLVYTLLVFTTVLIFLTRRHLVGSYLEDYINGNFDKK